MAVIASYDCGDTLSSTSEGSNTFPTGVMILQEAARLPLTADSRAASGQLWRRPLLQGRRTSQQFCPSVLASSDAQIRTACASATTW